MCAFYRPENIDLIIDIFKTKRRARYIDLLVAMVVCNGEPLPENQQVCSTLPLSITCLRPADMSFISQSPSFQTHTSPLLLARWLIMLLRLPIMKFSIIYLEIKKVRVVLF